MPYRAIFGPKFEDDLKQFKKDKLTLERLNKKINEILLNPERYKHLRNVRKGEERVKIGHFVLRFEVTGDVVELLRFTHHDKAYKQ